MELAFSLGKKDNDLTYLGGFSEEEEFVSNLVKFYLVCSLGLESSHSSIS